ncbi:MAG: hypothetical protein KAV18_06565 [Candidatus Omnitrophica bacterium]|nr:hypothetical protein [Candidatus Omnitrophota bacterium]
MEISKLKIKFEILQAVSFFLGLGIILLASLDWGEIPLIVMLIIAAALVSYKRNYLGAISVVLCSVIVLCLPYIGKKTETVDLLSDKVFLPYLILIFLYLETMARIRIDYYLYNKYSSSTSYSMGVKYSSKKSFGWKDPLYRIIFICVIYLFISFFYSQRQY